VEQEQRARRSLCCSPAGSFSWHWLNAIPIGVRALLKARLHRPTENLRRRRPSLPPNVTSTQPPRSAVQGSARRRPSGAFLSVVRPGCLMI
jgi:hypothetical protein